MIIEFVLITSGSTLFCGILLEMYEHFWGKRIA